MLGVQYRVAGLSDVPAMACLRGAERAAAEAWETRIARYLQGQHHPQLALLPRVAYVAETTDSLVGFIAGHLTRRYECDGELQWIDVVEQRRGQGIAGELLQMLATWFVEKEARRICVDPANYRARRFYAKHGAEKLNQHWLVWNDIQSVLCK